MTKDERRRAARAMAQRTRCSIPQCYWALLWCGDDQPRAEAMVEKHGGTFVEART